MSTPHFRAQNTSPVSVQHKHFPATPHLIEDSTKSTLRDESKCESSYQGSPCLREQLDDKPNTESTSYEDSNIQTPSIISNIKDDQLSRRSPSDLRREGSSKNTKSDEISSTSFVER